MQRCLKCWSNTPSDFQKDDDLLNKLIQRNALLKSKVVVEDEFEKGERKLLNFGHTLGHAIENDYRASAWLCGFNRDGNRSTYQRTIHRLCGNRKPGCRHQKIWPANFPQFNKDTALQNMMKDKKRFKKELHYVLLEKIGKARVQPLTIEEIEPIITQFLLRFMKAIIQPSSVSGSIVAPASKSFMQRACAAALVRKGESIIRNPGISNDDKAALNVIRALGATVNEQPDGSLQIISEGIKPETAEVNCGESGLGIRMFTPIIALSKDAITINGEGSLLSRPMNFFDEVLPKLNVEITSNNGKLPLRLKGPLQPKNISALTARSARSS